MSALLPQSRGRVNFQKIKREFEAEYASKVSSNHGVRQIQKTAGRSSNGLKRKVIFAFLCSRAGLSLRPFLLVTMKSTHDHFSRFAPHPHKKMNQNCGFWFTS